jgi:outer membrane immunogenic protein
VKMGWDASARLRIGYLVMPAVLLYGTGGVAWQSIQTTGTCQHSGPDPQCTFAAGTPFDTQTNSRTLTGGTIGAGIEVRAYQNWLLRGEYRYAHFSTFNDVLAFASAGTTVGTDFVR